MSAEDFDIVAMAVYDAVADNDLLDVGDVQSAGENTSPIDADRISLNLRRVDATRTPDMLADWHAEDATYRGGRTPLISSRAYMAVALTLVEEGTPMLLSKMATAFRVRLTAEARQLLGVDKAKAKATVHRDQRAWYARCARAVRTIIEPFNAWPAPGQVMSLAEREAVLAARTPVMQAKKAPRARAFTNAWLEMTLQALPDEYRNAWTGTLSADQTAVRAPSQLMPWRRDHEVEGSPEVPNKWEVIDENGDVKIIEAPRPVLEIDATPYPKDKSKKDKTFKGGDLTYELSFAANIVLMVTEPGKRGAHPQLAMAASLHKFGRSVAEHTLAAVQSIQDRGYNPKQLIVDLGYSAGIAPADFHVPLSKMGVQLISDYHRGQVGISRAIPGGALLVEGLPVCPATPVDLRTATKDANERTITPTQWREKKDRLKKFALRPKEAVNPEDGSQPWMCPARGLSPTVKCAIVEMSKKAKVDPTRPAVLKKMLPAHLDKVCRQHSVRIAAEDLAMFQPIGHGTQAWSKKFGHSRQSIESLNEHLKSDHSLHESRHRRIHGLAAQSFIFTLILTAANLKRVNKFLADRAAGIVIPEAEPPRKRDVEDRTHYHRWYNPPKVIRGQTSKEKRQEAARKRKSADNQAKPRTQEPFGEAEAFDNSDETATG